MNKITRQIAYEFVELICKHNPKNIGTLFSKSLSSIFKKLKLYTNKSYYSNNSERAETGYCGIRNLGCICYINAMIQQFYMTPTFRYSILMIDDEQ